MAEDNSAAGGGPRYAQDFNLEAVDIITDYGDTFKLKHLVIELSFFEDIYSFACSGNVVLRDAVGIIEKLRLDGSEFIEIIYGKSKNQPSEYKIQENIDYIRSVTENQLAIKTLNFLQCIFHRKNCFCPNN